MTKALSVCGRKRALQEFYRRSFLLRQHALHRIAGIQNQSELQGKIVVTFELVEMCRPAA